MSSLTQHAPSPRSLGYRLRFARPPPQAGEGKRGLFKRFKSNAIMR